MEGTKSLERSKQHMVLMLSQKRKNATKTVRGVMIIEPIPKRFLIPLNRACFNARKGVGEEFFRASIAGVESCSSRAIIDDVGVLPLDD